MEKRDIFVFLRENKYVATESLAASEKKTQRETNLSMQPIWFGRFGGKAFANLFSLSK